jgi:hypothetical protein
MPKKIPGFGAGPKYTPPDKLATTRKSKNSQVFDSVLAKIITVAQLFMKLATTFQLK